VTRLNEKYKINEYTEVEKRLKNEVRILQGVYKKKILSLTRIEKLNRIIAALREELDSINDNIARFPETPIDMT
jgi:hypothetical protein